MKDMTGVPIAIGDNVCCPTRQSSSLEMHYGKVIKMKDGNLYMEEWDDFSDKIKIRYTSHLERVVVIK